MLSRFHSRGPTYDFGSVTRIAFKYKLTGFRIKFFQKWFLCPSFCVCLFITVGLSTLPQDNCTSFAFNFDCPVHLFVQLSIFLIVLEVFNSKNLLSEAVVGLKLFYPKSFRKQFCALSSSKHLTLYKFTSHPQNFCRHNLTKACLVFLCFESWWSLVRERNITVIWKTVSEAVVGLNLLYPKSFQKQFCAFLKALEFQTICSRKTYATELRMFGRCLFVCFQSRWSQVRERNIRVT